MKDQDSDKKSFHDPTMALEEAIEKLELLVKEDGSDLDVRENGKIIATTEKPLERIMATARKFIAAIFSKEERENQKEKLSQIKEEILKAKDIAISHAYLIEKLKQGDSYQQKLAQRFLETIESYNTAVAQVQNNNFSWASRYAVKGQLLLDKEIKGSKIELPSIISIKYDSHPAQKTLKELSEAFSDSGTKKICSSLSPTYKKAMQLMIDTFRMKAIRMIQNHLSQYYFLGEIFQLIKQSPVEIVEEKDQEISMRQVLEVTPGSIITLVGSFERPSAESKLMSSIPILKKDSFRLSSQSIQTGFPYPSLHTSWTLDSLLIEACPLRAEQVPLFQQIEQRKRKVAQALLFDIPTIMKTKQLYKTNREIFDHNYSEFLNLHRQLNEAIVKEAEYREDLVDSFNSFYAYVATTSSPFDTLIHIQQQLLYACMTFPAKKLHEEWLESGNSILRTGNYQEKYQAASRLMKENRLQFLSKLDRQKTVENYLYVMGIILGQAAQSIVLQYMSEKIGFAPPMFSDFEFKVQLCAFHQLITFLDKIEKKDETKIDFKQELHKKLKADLEIFQKNQDQLSGPAIDLVNELEVYFNSRFYISNKNK